MKGVAMFVGNYLLAGGFTFTLAIHCYTFYISIRILFTTILLYGVPAVEKVVEYYYSMFDIIRNILLNSALLWGNKEYTMASFKDINSYCNAIVRRNRAIEISLPRMALAKHKSHL